MKVLNKKALFIGLLFCIFVMSPSGAVFGKEIELKLASWTTPKHFASISITQFIDGVNEKGQGKVKIIHYPGGQLYGPKDLHKVVAKGLVDMGQALQPRMINMVPMLQGVYLPFAFDNLDQVVAGYEGESGEILDKAMAKKNLKMIYPIFNDGIQLFSNKAVLKTVDDFNGLRVLTTSNVFSRTTANLGAAPDTSIAFTDQYMALKRKVADATYTTTTAGYFRKTYEVCNHVTYINMAHATLPVIINLKTWKKLPNDVKALMMEEGKKAMQFSIASAKGWEKKFKGVLIKKGATIETLQVAERNIMKEKARSVWMDWAKKTGGDAQRLLELKTN